MTITIDDVQLAMPRELTGDEADRADKLIPIASALVESALPGWSFTEGSETVTIDPADRYLVWTPRYPVSDVASVEVEGTAITDFTWDVYGRIALRRGAGPALDGPDLGLMFGQTTITYSYGLDPTPPDMAFLVATMVAATLRRQGANPDGVLSEHLGPYEVTYGSREHAAANDGMAAPPASALPRKWRRLRQVSVPLGTTR